MSTEHSRPSQGGSKGNWLVAGVILVLAISGGIYIQFFGPGRSHQNANPKVVLRSAEECRRMMELNNKALGLLENYEVTAAIESLRAVAEGLPEEPTVVRNLALAHVMAVEKKLEADHLDGLLEKLRRLEPESPIADYFAARAALARKEHAAEAGDFDTVKELEMTGVKFLEAAAQRSPKDASLWFEIAEIAANSPDEELRGKRVEALRQAYALAPDNLAATTRWLIAQAEIQDESIAETLKGARSSFAPLVASVKQRSAISDPEKLLDAAEQALEKGQWNQIRPPVRQLDNVIKPEEWWQSDYRRIKGRHVLEFVAHQFTKTHCSQEPETVDAIDIKLERRPASGALGEVSSAGVVELRVMDFDLDGMFDVAVLEGDKLSVFGRGDLTRDWELLASVSLTGSVRGLLVADLDRESVGADGKPAPASERNKPATDEPDQCQNADVDLVVYGPEGVSVFRNELDKETGKRQLLPVEQTPDFQNLREILAGALVDIDADGDLDLVFSSSAGYTVWMNRGDAQFIDASARSALPPQGLLATTLVPFDWNQDLDLDVIAVGPGGEPAGYLENLRHGQFRWRPFEGSAKELAGARQVCLGDALQPGRWDLYAAGESGVKRVRHAIRFPLDDAGDAGEPALPISSSAQERLLMVDIDNDSLSDLVSWNEETLSLFRATEVGLVHDQTGLLDKRPTGVRGCAVGDLDNDGDVDLVVADADGVALYANAGGNRRHWIDVRVRGEVDQRGGGRVNHLGVGSLIEVKAGSMYRARLVSEQVTHLGLGKHRQADVVRVVWTNGVPQAIVGPKPDQTLCEVHKTVEGSCPYVYAWNGEAFEFVTDLLWNAPLGLQIVEGVFAQPRAWEFLKIDGERLRPREGKYALQFTSELWEADYFDQVELIAVDHPADVQIFSNEKVGPAEIAQFQVHTVRQPRLPVAARNKLGEDVLPTIREADQVYLKGYTQIHRPGLADEHYLELDLGDLQGARQITLFLTGWIYPSDTSIRVGASQNPNWPQPKPPALAVPDSQGVWQEVRPFMGFPGGKPKTIAVDLSDAFLTDDFRLRIVTNWEIYWDHVFFTVDEEPAPLQLTTIPVAGADLHFRGFSAIRRRGLENPEHYDYGTVTTSPRWPPMFGRFTRYGDITSLLHQADDLLAILSPGDEMTLTFDVPSEPVPDGWKRDFLLHNVGWDKDAVLNTLYGQTVEPLPFQGMSGYPYGPDEAYPQTPRHLEYLRQYQTRTQSPARFWNWIRDHTPQTPALRP